MTFTICTLQFWKNSQFWKQEILQRDADGIASFGMTKVQEEKGGGMQTY